MPLASRSQNINAASYEHYFLKPNGVLNRNGHAAFMATLTHWRGAPTSLDRTRELLGVKLGTPSLETLLRYEFANDLEAQIPGVDTAEYVALKIWMAKNTHSLSTLTLDKIHTYLTNRQNRKTYEPREPEAFPVSQPVRAIAAMEGIQVLDTDQKLRAEGRKQRHCIGTASYLNRCRQGYQALNFKGYTFFLDPSGRILETRGSLTAPRHIASRTSYKAC